MGDRSPKDNLCRAGREAMFDHFLDYVELHKGQLVILGDFFELLRYPLDGIIEKRCDLLDRLAAMHAAYVPGNHDEDVFSLVDPRRPPHPFFAGVSGAFTQVIGNRRFRFMHGHEIDPFVNVGWKNIGRMIGAMAYHFELRRRNYPGMNDYRLNASLRAGYPVLRLRSRLRRGMNKTLRECCCRTSVQRVKLLTRQIRTQHMITRYYEDKAEDTYDVAIAGHTHHAAAFGDWFFNSGSWTERNNEFLMISPHGRVEVLDWTACGPQLKDRILAA